jgi:hypothetical protein
MEGSGNSDVPAGENEFYSTIPDRIPNFNLFVNHFHPLP